MCDLQKKVICFLVFVVTEISPLHISNVAITLHKTDLATDYKHPTLEKTPKVTKIEFTLISSESVTILNENRADLTKPLI